MKSAIELAERENKKITKQNKIKIQYTDTDINLDNMRNNGKNSDNNIKNDLIGNEDLKNN